VVVAGLAWPFYFCYFYTRATELVPVSKAGTATSIVALSDGLAATVSSYALTGLMGATGATAVEVWPTFGVVLFAVAIISIVGHIALGRTAAPSIDKADASAPSLN
jgi:hypothetical protein